MAPQHLAAGRIERRDLVQRSEHVEHAVDHERRRLQPAEARFVAGAEQRLEIEIGIDGPPAPGDFEIAEIVGVDLAEGGVLGGAGVGGVARPFAFVIAVLPCRAGSGQQQSAAGEQGHQSLHAGRTVQSSRVHCSRKPSRSTG